MDFRKLTNYLTVYSVFFGNYIYLFFLITITFPLKNNTYVHTFYLIRVTTDLNYLNRNVNIVSF